MSVIIITWTMLTVSVEVVVSDAGRASDDPYTRPRSTQPTQCTLCDVSNKVDAGTQWTNFTSYLAACESYRKAGFTVMNVCVGKASPTLATWKYTVNVFIKLLPQSWEKLCAMAMSFCFVVRSCVRRTGRALAGLLSSPIVLTVSQRHCDWRSVDGPLRRGEGLSRRLCWHYYYYFFFNP